MAQSIPMFIKTTFDDFSILKNGIDDRFEIIQHIDTGFYNITKMTKLVNDLKREERNEEAMPIRIASEKLIGNWIRNQDTIRLINACQVQTGFDKVRYELKTGTPKRFAGTYVHRYLYNFFMVWLDTCYAMKAAIILDKAHVDANIRIIKEKDDKIDNLTASLDAFREEQHLRDQEQRQRDQEQYDLLSKTHSEATQARTEATQAHSEATRSREMLEDLTVTVDSIHADHTTTSYHSTPIVESDLTSYFALTSTNGDNGNINFRAWRGQKCYIEQRLIKAMVNNGHELVIPPTYVAGPINVPIDAIRKINENLHEIADTHNANRDNGEARWSYGSLIRITGLHLVKVHPVWAPNEHITRSDMVSTYIDVIRDSQGRSFHVPEMSENLQATVDARRKAYEERIAAATGSAREHLEAMAEMIRHARERMNEPV